MEDVPKPGESVSASLIVMMTAARQSGVDDGINVLLPCRCRLSHNAQQSHQWVVMIMIQLGFWLCVSRPGFIAFVLVLSKCYEKTQQRRSTSLQTTSTNNVIEMVSTSRHASTEVMSNPAISSSSALTLSPVSSRHISVDVKQDDFISVEHVDNPAHIVARTRRSLSRSQHHASTDFDDLAERIQGDSLPNAHMEARVKARKFVSMRHTKRAENKRLAMSAVSSAGSYCIDEEKAQTMIGNMGTIDEAGVQLEVSSAGGATTGVDSGAGSGDPGSEWQSHYDENTGHYYWLHGTTGESTWHDPFA